jgi:hypothetical protein
MTPEPKITKLPKAVPNDRDEQGYLKKPVSFPNLGRTRGRKRRRAMRPSDAYGRPTQRKRRW